MAQVRYFVVALLTVAALTTPALARKGHVVHRKAMDAYASVVTPDTAYYPNAGYDAGYYPNYAGYYPNGGYYAGGACVRAPDVGAFASDPWRQPPCEPGTGYYGYSYGYGW